MRASSVCMITPPLPTLVWNSTPPVSVGQSVSQGDVIGYVGTTGNSTGNHLHLELRVNGARTNPLNYVPH